MDDDLKQFEAELAQLQPAAPRAGLTNRIAAELAEAQSTSPGWRWLWAGLALPVATALTLWLGVDRHGPGYHLRPTADTALKPVSAENILIAAEDEGLVTLDDGSTARRARLQYVDTITWRNPRTNASLTWTLPREEVRVVPVSFQ